MKRISKKQEKNVIVTGATGAIGEAVARQIAASGDYRVILAVRDENKAQVCVERIVNAAGNPSVAYELVDFSSRASIQAFSERWQQPLYALVNNAAIAPRVRQETSQGIELQFATNVLGYLWMTIDFLEQLKSGVFSRVVNIASNYAGGLDINDLEFKRRRYDNHSAYRQSKQANRMLSAALAERLASDNIVVNACHPGVVNSQLAAAMGASGPDLPDDGARTAVWLATHPDTEDKTGKYFVNKREVTDKYAMNKHENEQLLKICLDY
jgi:NAD(P)-dependent dehydrogenase (short-subunit alcohol dehydrogenase family)